MYDLAMSTDPPALTFSLLGGPLYQLGARLGLVRNGTNTIALGIAIGLFLWLVIIVLAFVGGVGDRIFSLSLIAGHMRLLLVIPLMFVCETVLEPRMTEFVRFLVRWNIVPEEQVGALNAAIRSTSRAQRSWMPEAVFLFAAALMSVGAMRMNLGGNTSGFNPGGVVDGAMGVSWWYSAVCLTAFRFLVFRWVWRLGLWTWFLWRVSRLKLRLLPTHPDGAGGLGFLEVVHTHFVPLVLGLSVLRASTFAEEIVAGTASVDAIHLQIAIILLLDAVVFIGPLLLFTPRLWICRVQGMSSYMGMAEQYVSQFDSKWLGKSQPQEPLLGTPDMQSLADLTNSVRVVRDMRWVPASMRLVAALVVAALLPMLPLVLFKYPITELTTKLFTGLVGL
jgi:hypothetical protein